LLKPNRILLIIINKIRGTRNSDQSFNLGANDGNA